MDVSLKATNNQISDYNKRIAEEARRMEADSQAKREETNRKLEEARACVAQADSNLKSIQNERRAKSDELDDIKKKGNEAEAAKSAAERRIQEMGDMIKQCKQQQQNEFAPYGRGIKELVGQIEKMKWFGEKPLGPLGRYVKVREPEKWAALLRSQLGQYLTAFAITDARDRPQLKRMLDQSQKLFRFFSPFLGD
jgi:chromosome segregation ATPase